MYIDIESCLFIGSIISRFQVGCYAIFLLLYMSFCYLYYDKIYRIYIIHRMYIIYLIIYMLVNFCTMNKSDYLAQMVLIVLQFRRERKPGYSKFRYIYKGCVQNQREKGVYTILWLIVEICLTENVILFSIFKKLRCKPES